MVRKMSQFNLLGLSEEMGKTENKVNINNPMAPTETFVSAEWLTQTIE
jgi:hypothetical protein